jgi:hypothetical protein
VFHAKPPPLYDHLLSDVSWDILTRYFPKKRLHAVVKDGEEPLFIVTRRLRTLAMLPVERKIQRTATTFWVPFLVDTGSPDTFFTQATIDALRLDSAAHQSVFGERIRLRTSSRGFSDINLLGTDVLDCACLVIDYPKKLASLTRATDAPANTFWVRVGDTVVTTVTPHRNDIDALKTSVKVKLESWDRDLIVNPLKMTVKKHDGSTCHDMGAALETNWEETAYEITL